MARHEERDDSYDLLNQYLHEIAQVPRLTPERERELGKRVQENDKAALEELVKANLRFVVSYAKKYRNAHVLFLDLINEGNIGLIHAAKKFDPDKNVKFITYAVWWIRQSILHALSEQGGAFRLPPKRANLMYRLEKAIGAAMTEGKHIPTADELATELGVTVKEVQTLLHANSDNFSLNAELDDDSHTELAEMIEQTSVPSVEDAMQVQGRRDELLAHMSELSPKERLVLSLRHGVTDNVPKRIDELAQFLNRESEQIASGAERRGPEGVRRADDYRERACATAALHEPEREGVVVLLVRARRPRRGDDAADRPRAHAAARRVAQAAGRCAKSDRVTDDRGEDDPQAALWRAAGRRADAARHRRDPEPVPRTRTPDRVAS